MGDNTDLELQSMIIKPARVCLGANFSLEHHCDIRVRRVIPRVRKVIPQMLLPSKTGTKHLDIKECIRNIYIAYTGMCISD